ncbi:MAG: hypothetical protein PVJ57_17115 [Phycisphaerae bacterium]|jgi:hypothetical protein
MSRSIVERLADEHLVALAAAGDAWPRALLSTTPVPDGWLALVERRDGGRRLVPAGEDPAAERGDRLLLVRDRSLTVPLHLAEVRTASGHAVSATVEIVLRWQGRDDDVAALGRSLLVGDELTLDQLARAVDDGGGRATLLAFIRERGAVDLVHEDCSADLLAVLREGFKRFLFSSGATLERLAVARFASPALAEEETLRRETAAHVERIKAHEMVQQAALAATQRRLEGLSGIFTQLQSAAGGDERMQWHDLLPALSPGDRGRLLENLWRITPDRYTATAIVVVAGQECLWLAPAPPHDITRRVTLAESLGGVRSVAFCSQRNWLLVGAARGVWALAADSGETQGCFEVPDAPAPRTGFNAIAVAGDVLYATHSQLGCWRWPLAEPDKAECLLAPADGQPRAVRAVTATDDGRILFATDQTVQLYDPAAGSVTALADAGDTIHSLATIEQHVFIGTADGRILQCALDGGGEHRVVHRARHAIESIQPRRWNDLIELVMPAGIEGIAGVFCGEGLVGRLMSAAIPIRRAWACDDLVTGLTTARDRLIVLNANLPDVTPREVAIARETGHSVQDACLIVAEQAEPEDRT